MADLAPAVAQMLITGDGIRTEDDPEVWVDAILDRWPDISADEIERGFRIASEIQRADDLAAGMSPKSR
ncbi:hypothetical protein [Methylorubrum extorquens]|uniref:Uncharacterized protein n=1 Tax=Methylorubrum extorquens DSM 13060 TaxID=882800 RepID=H1KG84_METEX|nr:hypothetical protein [Methylorubrum extorquens]EHP93425.1 hypothetical protein MetexDRAFT_1646 [Methylorubrum extorquens DSM 13060]